MTYHKNKSRKKGQQGSLLTYARILKGCVVSPYSSRVCSLGTKCCTVRHERA